MMKNILKYNKELPKIKENTFIADNARVIGRVRIGSETGIWFNVTIRGDVEPITIGNRTNIQDGSVIHVTRGGGITTIGDNVTIGHMALIHAAEIQSNSFIGMGSMVMDNCVIEEYSWVAAGSLITNGKTIKSGEIWAGRPAKFFRKMTEDEKRHIDQSATNYVKHVYEYLQNKKSL
jgi:carbonic anhydrase/acetyltransferase-like protein (isoleucine patch superfamily)